MSQKTTCLACGRQVDLLRSSGLAYEVIGYERERSAGGTNHVLFRRRTGRVLCQVCVHTRRDTGNAMQESLL